MNQQQPQLPQGFTLLENQVAGHTFSPDTQALGMVKDVTVGCVLKPMGKPQCGERELRFYESLTHATDPILVKARELVPKFYNKLTLQVNGKEHTFLKMEDITQGMRQPCIMDIKIGIRTWDPLASPYKILVEEEKYLLSKRELGLSLPGFQVYKEGGLQKYGKDYGKKLHAAGLRDTIKKFLNAEHKVCQPLILELLKQLYAIREWFKQQNLFHFYASSLLIVYDFEALTLMQQQQAQQNGSLLTNGSDIEAQINSSSEHINSDPPIRDHYFPHNNKTPLANLKNFVKVRMIDFAHVFPAENGQLDNNYLFGLENLIRIIEELNN